MELYVIGKETLSSLQKDKINVKNSVCVVKCLRNYTVHYNLLTQILLIFVKNK